jgi:hypothetical protein
MQIFCSPFGFLCSLFYDSGHQQTTNNNQPPVSVVVLVVVVVVIIKGKANINFTLEQAMKAQSGSVGIAVLFL